VRVLDAKPQIDSAGNAFFAFAIDARYGWGGDEGEARWTKNVFTGCVYPGHGDVFIKRGDAYHPAIAALGKKTKPAPADTCHAAAQVGAR